MATRPPSVKWLGVPLLLLAFLGSAAGAGAKPSCGGRPATIVSNAPKIVGTKAPDVIVAGPGDNMIYGEGGNDVICAGGGNDTAYGGRGDDTVFGEEGNDAIYGERGSDDLDGGAGEDRLLGATGNDELTGRSLHPETPAESEVAGNHETARLHEHTLPRSDNPPATEVPELTDHRRLSPKIVSDSTRTVTLATPSSDSGLLLSNATHLSDFWLMQAAPGAISEVPDPAGSGETVFKLTVGDSDMLNISPNPRAQLASPSNIRAGDEFWWSAKFFLPADFPASIPGWLNLLEGPYGSPFNGSPPWQIAVNGNHIQWARNSTYGWDVPWQMPLVRNSWVSVMMHERFAPDGFVEMWVNGEPITFFGSDTYNPNHVAPTQHLAMQTMDSSNNGATNSIYLQSYRKLGMFPSLTVYQGPLEIGTTRASVGG
jgi:Ca2+-binding RTX toxin-like protein